jgi:hypothetical protein
MIDLAPKIAYSFFTFSATLADKVVWVFIQFHAATPHGKLESSSISTV